MHTPRANALGVHDTRRLVKNLGMRNSYSLRNLDVYMTSAENIPTFYTYVSSFMCYKI